MQTATPQTASEAAEAAAAATKIQNAQTKLFRVSPPVLKQQRILCAVGPLFFQAAAADAAASKIKGPTVEAFTRTFCQRKRRRLALLSLSAQLDSGNHFCLLGN